MTPEEKLRRARTMLVLGDGDEPFFGSVALGLDLIPLRSCQTASTDGRSIVYNPDWIDVLTVEESMTLFEHEVYHVVLKHALLMIEIVKEPDFNMELWQRACDIPINNRLIKKGRDIPVAPNGFKPVFMDQYDGMSAVRIYRLMMEDLEQQKLDFAKMGVCDLKQGHGDQDQDQDQDQDGEDQDQDQDGEDQDQDQDGEDQDQDQDGEDQDKFEEETGGFGGVMPLKGEDGFATKKEIKEFEQEFEQRIANASRILQKELESDIGDLPEFIQEIVKAHTEPQRTYKDLITDVLEEITRDDYCWGKPNIKYIESVYLPSLYEKTLNTIVVIVDTSGSISRKELEIYASELSGILAEFDGFEIAVIFHNTRAYKIKMYSSEDLPVKFDQTQSGGTDYKHAYQRINEFEDEPVVIFHFTDLDVNQWSYPDQRPGAEVFWMNTTPRLSNGNLRYSTPPWGTVIDLDINK